MILLPRPATRDEVVAMFGDYRNFMHNGDMEENAWRNYLFGKRVKFPSPLPLGWDSGTLAFGMYCHHRLVPTFQYLFNELREKDLWKHLHTFDGCYNFRVSRGSYTKLSLHAWAIAVDFNAATNQLGTDGDMHPDVIEVFESNGFVWGGRFSRPDPMHFQYADPSA